MSAAVGADSGNIGYVDESEPFPSWRPLLVMAAPSTIWWMANIGFLTLGLLDTDETGFRAWQHGFGIMPHWLQAAFAYASPPMWISGALLVGTAVAVRGRKALVPSAAYAIAISAGAAALLALANYLNPDAL